MRELAGLDDEHAFRLVHKLDLVLWQRRDEYTRTIAAARGLAAKTSTLESPLANMVIHRSRLNAKINRNFEVFAAADFLAATTQHIPDKGAQMVRYYGSSRAAACHRPLLRSRGKAQRAHDPRSPA